MDALDTEPSFVPHDFANRFGVSPQALLRRMDKVFRETAQQHRMTLGYVIAPNRGRDVAYLLQAAQFAVEMRDCGVVAFGYGGDESLGHSRMLEAVDAARAGGLRIVPHAGEMLGPESVDDALKMMKPDRLAHGTSAIKDGRILNQLARLHIPCDVCITSNVRLGSVSSASTHPLLSMLEAGVPVTLNADDTTFFSSLLSEYTLARQSLGLSDVQLAQLARNSLEAACMPAAARRRALTGLDKWLRNEQFLSAEGSALA